MTTIAAPDDGVDSKRHAGALKITEIFHSLQGESNLSGWPTVFVRLTGCPLRCRYCDTAYAFTGGEWWSQADILARVAACDCRHVCVTGGEPLAQKHCLQLLRALCDAGYTVSLETGGALPVAAVDPRVVKVLDIKTPASGEADRNRWDNLSVLQPHDQLKFVICDRADYDWARRCIEARGLLDQGHEIWFSPSHGQLEPRNLAEWILEDRLPVRMQLQLHKYIWGDVPGR